MQMVALENAKIERFVLHDKDCRAAAVKAWETVATPLVLWDYRA